MAGAVAAGPVESGFTQTATYAAVDAAGPTLSVAPALLDESLSCTPGLAGSGRAPVLLVPGTNVTPEEHFSWNYMRAFDDLGWPYCTVATPKHATEDLQISAEYVVHAIRTMHGRSGRRIAILGGSQGGMLPRWALRFWPDTRALVDDLVGLAATNHGGQGIAPLCVPDCAPALWQQLYGSEFMRALNSGQETFPGISYTAVYSHQDGLANPAADDTGTSSSRPGSPSCRWPWASPWAQARCRRGWWRASARAPSSPAAWRWPRWGSRASPSLWTSRALGRWCCRAGSPPGWGTAPPSRRGPSSASNGWPTSARASPPGSS